MHIVHVALAGARLEGRVAKLDAAGGHFGVERIAEDPAFAGALAAIAQVLPVGRQLDGERLRHVDPAGFAVELPEGDHAAVVGLVVLDGAIAEAERHGVLATLDDVVGVGRHERAAVVADGDRVLDDLLHFKVAQVDDRHAGVGLVVDEQEVTVIVTVGLAEGRMMGVGPGERLAVDGLTTLSQNFLRAQLAIAEALPRLRGEDGDLLQDAHRRQTNDVHLARLAAGGELIVLVVLAAGGVGLDRGGDVGRGQATLLGDGVDVFRRAGYLRLRVLLGLVLAGDGQDSHQRQKQEHR